MTHDTPLFDLHCDTLAECFAQGGGLAEDPARHIDLLRGGAYAPWAQVFAVFTPDSVTGAAAWKRFCAIVTLAREQGAAQAARLTWVRDGAALDAAVAAGRCAGILAVEGGSILEGRVERIAQLAAMGVRLFTITWNGSNELGHGCLSGRDDGLTGVGRAAVAEMARCGILPDVSHLNERGFWDVAAATEGVFVATHSVSRAVHGHPRNLTDAQFGEIARRGGVVGVNLCEEHLGAQTFGQVERHLAHYWELGGADTVAWGADFDGTDIPPDWNGIAVMERLRAYLRGRGYAEELLTKLFWSNARRVLG